MPARIAIRRFRWRLTIAFVLVSGISAAILAAGSYLLVSQARDETFLERSLRDSQVSYSIASEEIGATEEIDLRSLVFQLKRQTGAAIVGVTADEIAASDPELGRDDIPDDLVNVTETDEGVALRHTDAHTDKGDHLVITDVAALDDVDLYFFY